MGPKYQSGNTEVLHHGAYSEALITVPFYKLPIFFYYNSLPVGPGGRHGRLLQHSCLENSMDRGPWWAIRHGVAESDMTAVT